MGCGCGGSGKSKPSAISDPETYWNGPRRKAKAQTAAAPKPQRPKK